MSTLVRDIEPPGSDQTVGSIARARLEIALDGLDANGGFRRVVVIDSAENLLQDENLLRDSEFDLALEAVQSRPNPLVKVVLVTQRMPEATTGVAWTDKAVRICLSGLKPPSLREQFAVLDPSDRYGLAALPEKDLRRVHGRLAGSPRLAELLSAVISSDPPGLQIYEVGAWLSSVSASEVHQRLVHLFVERLPAEEQRVAEGLAALGIPAGTDDVIGILEPYVPALRIEPALRSLVATGLVLERRDGRRYLRTVHPHGRGRKPTVHARRGARGDLLQPGPPRHFQGHGAQGPRRASPQTSAAVAFRSMTAAWSPASYGAAPRWARAREPSRPGPPPPTGEAPADTRYEPRAVRTPFSAAGAFSVTPRSVTR
ncbi:hypothetical protein [Streptomyces atriruber]|uniref:hypothetical protein n=1 Tax=Streptomyces atriruber TaxID=545121 RepID=UPI001428D1B9|nr:hypothetical protein [Streptomyces atriruber]